MAWSLNPAYVGTHILRSTFNESGFSSAYLPNRVIAFSGTMPASPAITSGITALNSIATITTPWNAPSDGVNSLASAISITPNANGTLSFLRFYNTNTSVPLFDVSCSLIDSDDSAKVSTLSIYSGTPFTITDLRMKLNTSGNISVSPSIANDFIGKMTNGTPITGHSYGLYAASNYDVITGLYNRVVSIKLYSGTIPSRADTAPTGTELWTINIPWQGSLFNLSGLGLSLAGTLTSNAIASGTPTYCRIRKAGYTSSGYVWPECIIQIPVTTDGSGCTLSSNTFTSGQSYTMTGLTLTL